jgi:hypothetical protein
VNLSGKQQAAIEYGVGALAGGVTRFVFGRDVIEAARAAFADAPDVFPAHLTVHVKAKPDANDPEAESNRALTALEEAATATGNWIADTASTVGGGVAASAVAVGTGAATAADTVTRPFRSVDIDGDGIPDEPQALTAVKGVGGAIAGAADAVGESVAGLFKLKKRGRARKGRVDQVGLDPDQVRGEADRGTGELSERIAIPRHCSSRLKQRSTTSRPL